MVRGWVSCRSLWTIALVPVLAADAACDVSPRTEGDVVVPRHLPSVRVGDFLAGLDEIAAVGARAAVELRGEAALPVLHEAKPRSTGVRRGRGAESMTRAVAQGAPHLAHPRICSAQEDWIPQLGLAVEQGANPA